MAEIDLTPKTSPRRLGCLVVVIGSVLIGGGIFFIISLSNSSRMELVARDGQLAVYKGSFLPWGEDVYQPHQAYAPVEIPDDIDVESLPTGVCEDEAECERLFYRAVIQMTQAVLEKPSKDSLQTAKNLIVRAQIFPTISLAERAPIEDLTGAIHYVEALVILESSHEQLALARKKLERSRIAEVPFVEQQRIEKLIELLEQQLVLFEKLKLQTEPLKDAL